MFAPLSKNPRLHMRFETNGLVDYSPNFFFENLFLSEKIDIYKIGQITNLQ